MICRTFSKKKKSKKQRRQQKIPLMRGESHQVRFFSTSCQPHRAGHLRTNDTVKTPSIHRRLGSATCLSWLPPGKVTRISHGKNPKWDNKQTLLHQLNTQVIKPQEKSGLQMWTQHSQQQTRLSFKILNNGQTSLVLFPLCLTDRSCFFFSDKFTAKIC